MLTALLFSFALLCTSVKRPASLQQFPIFSGSTKTAEQNLRSCNTRITENPSKRPTLRLCLPLHRRHVSSEKSFSALHLLGCNWKVPPHPSGGLGSPQGSANTRHRVWGRGTEGPILGPRQPPTVEAADAHGGGSSLLGAAGNSPCLWVNDQKTL